MKLKATFLSAILVFALSCEEKSEDNTPESYLTLLPKSNDAALDSSGVENIILLIADGTGLTQVSAAFYFQEEVPNFARFKNIGLMKSSSTSKITDSAAGATAFSAGVKTYNGAIGVDADKNSVPTIVELLSEDGWATGVVATSSITHATPASFYAHVESRGMAEAIADDLVDSEIDYFAGGGLEYFAKRDDNRNLIDELKTKGFEISTEGLENFSGSKQGFLLEDDALPPVLQGRGDFLTDATVKGIELLNRESNFFLMVEGSQVDWGGHANNSAYLISELLDFDKAVGAALDFADQDGNTLVIVTADHETGGFTLSSKNDDYDQIQGTFSTGGHSTSLIPVFAYGPGSELFQGVYENTDIFFKMLAAIGKD